MIQDALLFHVMTLYPTPLTEEDLIRELAGDPEDFGKRDAVAQAIRDLVRVGLLHSQGGFVVPSRAALYAAELFEVFGRQIVTE